MTQIQNFEDYKKISDEGSRLYNEKNYKGAFEKFTALAKANYDNFKVHETLSYIHLKLNDPVGAEKEYRIALEIAKKENRAVPRERTFDEIVKDIKKETGDAKKIVADYQKVMKEAVSPAEVQMHVGTAIQLGILYMAKGQYSEAEKILQNYKTRYQALVV
jgi:tetratricopeptide (TPR) repeat protein